MFFFYFGQKPFKVVEKRGLSSPKWILTFTVFLQFVLKAENMVCRMARAQSAVAYLQSVANLVFLLPENKAVCGSVEAMHLHLGKMYKYNIKA